MYVLDMGVEDANYVCAWIWINLAKTVSGMRKKLLNFWPDWTAVQDGRAMHSPKCHSCSCCN